MAAPVVYRVNSRDELTYLNDEWGRFAAANAGAALTPERVLGRPLWDFITGLTADQLYRDLLARVRAGHPARFPFRCDSPGVRRRMEMEVLPAAGGAVEFRAHTLAEEPRPPQPLLDAAAPRTSDLLRSCGWCRRVEVGGWWAEVEEAVRELGLFERAALPGLTHAVCGDCFEAMTKSMRGN
jgi:hypothetical protein